MLAALDPWILAFSLVTVVVTIWMGFRSAKTSKSASDFFVAGRSVSVGWNASAISGEYLSAASFMGVAGMVMSSGYDALWYPVCYACGYLFLLLFIAGPLRRFGAYTIPDFAEGRYDSPVFRKIAVIFVLFIGFFYTMPQMKGAGTTLAYIFPGLPYWVGVVLVGAVITLNVALGGMKGITLVQAFQYWAKMFAISVPVFVLMSVYGGYGKQVKVNGATPAVPKAQANIPSTESGETGRPAAPRLTYQGAVFPILMTFQPTNFTAWSRFLGHRLVPLQSVDLKGAPGKQQLVSDVVADYAYCLRASARDVETTKITLSLAEKLKFQPIVRPPLHAQCFQDAATQLENLLRTNGVSLVWDSARSLKAFPTSEAILVNSLPPLPPHLNKVFSFDFGGSVEKAKTMLAESSAADSDGMLTESFGSQFMRYALTVAAQGPETKGIGKIEGFVTPELSSRWLPKVRAVSIEPSQIAKELLSAFEQHGITILTDGNTFRAFSNGEPATSKQHSSIAGTSPAGGVREPPTGDFTAAPIAETAPAAPSMSLAPPTTGGYSVAMLATPVSLAKVALGSGSSVDPQFLALLPHVSSHSVAVQVGDRTVQLPDAVADAVWHRGVNNALRAARDQSPAVLAFADSGQRPTEAALPSVSGTNLPAQNPLLASSEVASRLPLPTKAPKDETWLNPFGPLTTKAAKAAKPTITVTAPTEAAELELTGLVGAKPDAEGRFAAVELFKDACAMVAGQGLTPESAAGRKIRVTWSKALEGVRVPPLDSRGFNSKVEIGEALLRHLQTNQVQVTREGAGTFLAYRPGDAVITPVDPKPYALLYTYSLIIALVCGTAGLPHILVRFYTNPDGVAAKRTTMWVMILIGIFYVFPPVFGVMGRNLMPSLYEGTGAKGTDKVVLELPKVLDSVGRDSVEPTSERSEASAASVSGAAATNDARSARADSVGKQGSTESRPTEKGGIPWGSILSGITCAGAFAAFMSTFSGLLVSMTGALAHDVYGRMLRPNSTPAERMRMFKFCAVGVGTVAVVLGSFVEPLQINFMVGQAFAIAAASYFPLLFMSVWWRGMTMRGAAAGMLTGGVCALAAVTLTNFSDLKWLPLAYFWAAHPLLRILCEQPAIWTVPLAIGLMVAVSKLTRATVPTDVRMKMLVLHAPEKLGLKQEYIKEHEAHGH